MSDEHSPEAYRSLFALIGAGLQAFALVFILASTLVAPPWVVAALLVVWVATTFWSWRGWGERLWLPTVTGTLVAVLWIVAVTVFTRTSGP
ncbi:MAG: hypothetical protein BMS9Abin07_0894 [Acidimicrobiia bacterium]|nr:MAG: hypothetical protein BMS9Abin07_0894 [Acidimicrobiia bacterium]